MASTIAIPQFINYPGTIPGQVPGHLPPVTLPVNAAFSNPNLPVTSANGVNTLTNVQVPTMQLPVVPVGGGCYNDGMEVVWHGEFSRLFSNFYPPHVWYLTITNQAPQNKWKFHRDSAKVRFCCQDCGNGWTSMKGRVTFWFYLDYENNAGFVQFKLYGQQCKKCNSGKFEYVMWYPEEVSKVMCNVYNKVGQIYYGFHQPPIRIDRRPGRPRNQHNSDLCQACRDGECDQARPIKPIITASGLVHAPLSIPAPPVPREASASSISVQNGKSPSSSESSPLHVVIDPPRSGASPVSVVQNENNAGPPRCDASTAASVTSTFVVAPLAVNNSNKPSAMVIPASNNGVITAPVTLTSGVQPILTYTVISGPPKSTSLSAASNQFVPSGPPHPPSCPYIFHPTPSHIVNGALPMHPPNLYSFVPPPNQHVVHSDVKPVTQINSVCSPNEMLIITAQPQAKAKDVPKDAAKPSVLSGKTSKEEKVPKKPNENNKEKVKSVVSANGPKPTEVK
ncbi:unnamed protein product [Clavelina lepadiformis]|uniref:3CxxC-type domain-containing protein n=1 Tax=Clavelina lepadiformis TaxID=159417 RepID=A0ABP0GC81_CLALP